MRIKTAVDITLAFVKESLGIIPLENDRFKKINAICTDSRIVQKNDLFFALPGENFDGENFILDAKQRGAFTVSSKFQEADVFFSSTVKALQKISGEYKKLLGIKKTVAITGSVGKTTTKNLTSKILETKYKVHSTHKNLNNEIGVPFTLLSAPRDSEILVIEAGMNHEGELAEISGFLKPDICVITKIGTAHIGNLGSREKIAKAKSEIISGSKNPVLLSPYGEILLNSIPSRKTVSVKTKDADFALIQKKASDCGFKFDFFSKNTLLSDISFSHYGTHIPECLAYAIAVSLLLDMTEHEITKALSKIDFHAPNLIECANGILILDDSYNSSPEAVETAFKTLLLCNAKHSALLGDMLELGKYTERLHYNIGVLAAKSKINFLYLFGEYSDFTKNGALSYGFEEKNIFVNYDTQKPQITAEAIKLHSKNEVILFKASRKLRLERIINILK